VSPAPAHDAFTVLVTGGAGYIGSHACKALAAAGYRPVAYDNLVHGHPWAVRWGPLVEGDLLDPARLAEAFARHRPRAVLHFAAYAYVGESVERPAKYYRNNVAGTLNLLEAMRAHGVDRLVFSSTCATYGLPRQERLREDHPQDPVNPYGRSKWMVERLLADYAGAYGLRAIALRYFNAAGADPEGELGELHRPETHLVPRVLLAAAGAGEAVTIHGDDYDTPDGTCVRDYVHVSDLARAHVLALEALDRGPPFRAYNLGCGAGHSVRQVIRRAEAVTGRPVPHRVGPRRAGDPPRLVADAAQARAALGWTPVWGDLDSLLAHAWRWTRMVLADGRLARG